VTAGAGDDRVFLGDGNDEYLADDDTSEMAGDDFVRGGAGRDVIIDLLGSNNLHGDTGADVLIAFDALTDDGVYDTIEEVGTTDTLSGGFGDDTLFGDAGDIMTGGAGEDFFYVTDDEDVDLAPVRITDFNVAEDALLVIQQSSLADTGSVTFTSTPQGVTVSFEGRTVAVLEGLGARSVLNSVYEA
jgi:Ca2+-binding RTX toxin-like protein